jgi:hypothetical protein
MRIFLCVVASCAFATTARADYSKAWTAAKDNLPATTGFVATLDVAAIVKLPAFGPLFATARKAEKNLDEGYRLLQQTCKIDGLTAVEGVVVAADPAKKQIAIFLQLAVDRARASTCFESLLKTMRPKKQTTVKQDGIYTVITIAGGSKTEVAYFAWVAPHVVAFVFGEPDKAKLDTWIGHRDFGKTSVASLFAKTDPKAAVGIAYSLGKPLDNKVLISSGYGHVQLAGRTFTAMHVGITPDATSAANGVIALDGDRQSTMKRKRTSPAMRSLFSKIAITSKGNEILIRASGGDTDVADVVAAELRPEKVQVPVSAPTPPTP